MMSILKSLSFRAMAATGLPHRVHSLLNQGKLTILMYHGIIATAQSLPDWCFVEVSSFHAQMKYLKKHFNVISLSEAVKLLKHGEVPASTAVITFDDGYQNNYDSAFPILCSENLPATIFLVTGLIDTDLTIWTGALHNAFSKTQIATLRWRGSSFDLSNIHLKQRALATIKAVLKREPHSILKDEVGYIVSILIGGETYRVEEKSPYRILDSKSILKMANSNLIEFGAHTHTHPILGNLSNQEQEREILKSIEVVKFITKHPCSFFAYPNGGETDYNSDTLSILDRSEIEASLTTIEGSSGPTTPLMELRRFGIGSDMNMATFKLAIHNIINRMRTRFGSAA